MGLAAPHASPALGSRSPARRPWSSSPPFGAGPGTGDEQEQGGGSCDGTDGDGTAADGVGARLGSTAARGEQHRSPATATSRREDGGDLCLDLNQEFVIFSQFMLDLDSNRGICSWICDSFSQFILDLCFPASMPGHGARRRPPATPRGGGGASVRSSHRGRRRSGTAVGDGTRARCHVCT